MAEAKTDPLNTGAIVAALNATWDDSTEYDLEAMAGFVLATVADELTRQADVIAERIRMHGLGQHGWCTRCEAWGRDEATLRTRAAELRSQEPPC